MFVHFSRTHSSFCQTENRKGEKVGKIQYFHFNENYITRYIVKLNTCFFLLLFIFLCYDKRGKKSNYMLNSSHLEIENICQHTG